MDKNFEVKLMLGQSYMNAIELKIRLEKTVSPDAYKDILAVVKTLEDIGYVYIPATTETPSNE